MSFPPSFESDEAPEFGVRCISCKKINLISKIVLREALANGTLKDRQCECKRRLIHERRFMPYDFLGQGGSGRAYLAWDLNTKRNVVIKRQRQTGSSSESQIFFQAEINVLTTLRNDFIPQIQDRFPISVGNNGGEYSVDCLVQDYAKGKTLSEFVKPEGNDAHCFSEDEIKKFLDSMLAIVQYIHSKRIIHRDIKPDNIIRNDYGEFFLVDFGSAIVLPSDNRSVRRSEIDAPVTFEYAAPEESEQEGRIGISADLYSLAATCMYLLTGDQPKTKYRSTTKSFSPELWKKAQVGDQLKTVLSKMLEGEPENRYRSAQAVQAALNEIREQEIQVEKDTDPEIGGRIARFLKKYKIPILFILAAIVASIVIFRQPILSALYPPPAPILTYGLEGYENNLQAAIITHLNNFRDPTKAQEAPKNLIFLSNAIAQTNAKDKSENLIKLALVDINGSDDQFKPQTTRGAAQAQVEFNCSNEIRQPTPGQPKIESFVKWINDSKDNQHQCKGKEGKFLQIGTKYYNKGVSHGKLHTTAELIAKENIQGVIGRYDSDKLPTVSDAYKEKNLALIAPTSNALRGQKDGEIDISNNILRITPSVSEMAKLIGDKSENKENIVFYDSSSSYSRSVAVALQKDVPNINLQLLWKTECTLQPKATSNFSNCLPNPVGNKEVNVIVIPSADNMEKVVQIVTLISKSKSNTRITLIGSDTVYEDKILKDLGGEKDLDPNNIPRFLVAVPWFKDKIPTQFETNFNNIFGDQNIPDWRTVMGYDTTQVLIQGLGRVQYKSDDLPAKFGDTNQEWSGHATEKIQFDSFGDRVPPQNPYVFVQIKYDERKGFYFDSIDQKAI